MRYIALILIILLCGCSTTKKSTHKPINVSISASSATFDDTVLRSFDFRYDSVSATNWDLCKGTRPNKVTKGSKGGGGGGSAGNAPKCQYDKNGVWGIVGPDGYVHGAGGGDKENWGDGANRPLPHTNAYLAVKAPLSAVVVDTIIISGQNEPNFGGITYSIPATMKVGEETRVSLRISRYLSASLTDGTPSGSVTKQIRVGSSMEAVIKETDPTQEAFKIDTLSTGVQTIENDSSYTTWEWSILPLKSGKQNKINGGN